MARKVAGRAVAARTGGAESDADIARFRRGGHIADHLHLLAGRVERLGRGRTDPERELLAKMDVVADLRALAAEFGP